MGLEINVFAVLALVIAMILAGASYILFTLIWTELDELSIRLDKALIDANITITENKGENENV